jgi:ABC-type glycerol-3-phosphate transport system substrate-binding protein
MRDPARCNAAALVLAFAAACGGRDDGERTRPAVVTVPGSLLGSEGRALRAQIQPFEAEHPGVVVGLLETPH